MLQGVQHVIMAGGSGTRFWPLSRAARPKQFVALVGGSPLLAQAFERAASISGEGNVMVVAGAAHKDLIHACLPRLDPSRLILEPLARNTGPCAGLAAMKIARRDPEAVIIMWPADHVYTNQRELERAVATAAEAAAAGMALVTLGIRPSRPETGYGYIELEPADAATGSAAGLPAGVRRARRFVEKPDAAAAARYVASGFLWNSGLFVWRAQAILEAIQAFAPQIWDGLRRIEAASGSAAEDRVTAEAFEAMPSISVDYAVLESSDNVLVVPCDPGWSDVGSWDAVAELQPQGSDANTIAGPADRVVAEGSRGCFVVPEESGRRLVALVGIEDLIVVDTGDALLICRKGESQSVRAVVEALRSAGRKDLL